MRAGMASGKARRVGGRSLPCGCSDGPAASRGSPTPRGAMLRCGAHEPAAGGPGRHEGLRGQALPLHAGGHRRARPQSR